VNRKSKKVSKMERATGIEPALPAWKAGNTLWKAKPAYGRDQDIQNLGSAALLVWVEIWVENRRCPESVNSGAG
jgi:hypothetical protein